MQLFISAPISDAATLNRLVRGNYPDGVGWASPVSFDFLYEGTGQPFIPGPIWNESAPTTNDTRNSLMTSKSIKQRGWYEIYAYGGVKAWETDIIVPQVQSLLNSKGASDPSFNAATYDGWFAFDWETQERTSFGVVTGSYAYLASQVTGIGAFQKRQLWELLVYDYYAAVVRQLRLRMPYCKLVDFYIVPQLLYQWNTQTVGTDPYHNGNAGATLVTELGMNVRDALRYQLYGGASTAVSIGGGARGWLGRILELFDAHGFEFYAKAGVSNPWGADTTNAQGDSVTTTPVFYSATLMRRHLEEMQRFAAFANRPMIGLININYPPLSTPTDDEGLNVYDATMAVEMLASAGANIGLWASDVPHTVNRAAGILQGTRNLCPSLAKAMGFQVRGSGNPVFVG